MRINLAGYNLDTELISAAREAGLPAEQLTPETISAAYARISRNPAPVDELRRQARAEVAKSRTSNQQIVFEMGHASVAEHAVFNFDLLDISRLAIEAVQHSRLCSFTEKSQRYIRLGDDFHLPQEIIDAGFADEFRQLVARQNQAYQELYTKLREHIFAQHAELAAQKSNHRLLEGWAKEDARYVTALATHGQLGMTLNARAAEQMIRRLAAHPLAEVRALGATLFEQTKAVAPSLIRYTEPRAQQQTAADGLTHLTQSLLDAPAGQPRFADSLVKLTNCPPDGDNLIAAGLLYSAAQTSVSWEQCAATVSRLSPEARREIFQTALAGLSAHEPPPRAFELVDLQYDLVVSAACFGQLKRHRLATILAQPYDPALGFTMPAQIEAVGAAPLFRQIIEESSRFFEKAFSRSPVAAAYGLTQAHRRRVLMQMNGRELYHFSRLRQDNHAQWDIRHLADAMVEQARAKLPLSLLLVGGKDQFSQIRSANYRE